ncbi:MAG TPA: hypothetical protein VF618_26785 [Thermoanaerobaculia bacterium]
MSSAPVLTETRRMNVAPLLGTWLNTNAHSRGITRIDVHEEDGMLRIVTKDFEATSLPYSIDGFDSQDALAFSTDTGTVRLQANIKGGVLVVAALTRGDVNLWVREFYYRRS